MSAPPYPPTPDDTDGNGIPDNEEIVVTGTRRRREYDPGTGGDPGTSVPPGPSGGGGGSGSQWSDPNQPTQNECANSGITITVSGNTITITGQINFEGPGADQNTNNQLLAALNQTWTGPFGSHTVITNMTMGAGGLTANVSGSTVGQPYTSQLGGSYIQTFTLNGASVFGAEFTMDSFAHEFGHTLGLMDLYDWRTGERASGYDNNIMGNSSVPPTAQNIQDLLDKLADCAPSA